MSKNMCVWAYHWDLEAWSKKEGGVQEMESDEDDPLRKSFGLWNLKGKKTFHYYKTLSPVFETEDKVLFAKALVVSP